MIRYSRNNPDKNRWYLPLLISLSLIVGIGIGVLIKDLSPGEMVLRYDSSTGVSAGEIDEVLQIIESRYYRDVNISALKDTALNAIFNQLDPYSQYISSDQNLDLNGQMNGQFDGIGIEYNVIDGKMAIIRVLPDGPADKAGLLQGDFIVGVNNFIPSSDSAGIEKITSLLKGPKGQPIQVQVDRYGEREVLDIEVIPNEINIETVRAAFMIDDSVAYINLKRFNANTYKSFMENIERLVEKEGMKDLILDLRGNPGGYLQEAVNILSQLFKEKGKLLVYTKGNKQKKLEYTSTGKSFFPIRKIAVLVDETSASASEILAGAIQDLDRGIIIGSPTFGKGLVQEHFNLKNGSGIRLTIANYYTPSGRSIQKSFEKGMLGIDVDTSVIYKTSRGRTVLGGQGIIPDIDINNYMEISTPLVAEDYEVASAFCFTYVREHIKDRLSLVESLKEEESELFQQFLNEFKQYYEERVFEERFQEIPQKLVTFLHERILYLLTEEEAYFKWLVENETASRLALENLNNALLLKASIE